MTPPLTDRLPILTEVIDPGNTGTVVKAAAVQTAAHAAMPEQGTAAAGGGSAQYAAHGSAAPVSGAKPSATNTAGALQSQHTAIPPGLLEALQEDVSKRLSPGVEKRIGELLQARVDTLSREIAGELLPWLQDEIRRGVTDAVAQTKA